MKKIINITVSLLIAILILGCAATVEGEQKSFDKVKSEMQGLSGIFNRYSPLVESQITELDSKWAKAMKIDEEVAKIEALEGVNHNARLGKIKPLYDLRRCLTKVESDIKYIRKRRTNEVEIATLKDMDIASDKLLEVENLVAGTPIKNIEAASMEINGFIMQLNRANKYVSIAVKQIKEKIEAEKRANEIAKRANEMENSSYSNENSSEPNTSSQPVQKMVKCKYCKRSYPVGSSKCKSCGARL